MRNKTCCFTGHRHLPQDQIPEIKKRLEQAVETLITQYGVRYFGCGAALGFDTLAAQTVIALREKYPEIALILVLPCQQQDKFWPAQSCATYKQIKAAADKIVYTAQTYYDGCMLKRNRHLADNIAYCICYLTESTGGTAYTVDRCLNQGVSVVNLARE